MPNVRKICFYLLRHSISENGLRPWYLEACSSTIAATYSSGEQEEGKVVSRSFLNLKKGYKKKQFLKIFQYFIIVG